MDKQPAVSVYAMCLLCRCTRGIEAIYGKPAVHDASDKRTGIP